MLGDVKENLQAAANGENYWVDWHMWAAWLRMEEGHDLAAQGFRGG